MEQSFFSRHASCYETKHALRVVKRDNSAQLAKNKSCLFSTPFPILDLFATIFPLALCSRRHPTEYAASRPFPSEQWLLTALRTTGLVLPLGARDFKKIQLIRKMEETLLMEKLRDSAMKRYD